jgi:hypothetical protein
VNGDKPDRVLRPKLWLVILVMGMGGVSAALAVLTYRYSGWNARSGALAALALLACVGLAELGTLRIVLSRGGLEVRKLWRVQRYAIEELESVTWEAGVGVSIRLAAGGWARLPELGYNAQGLANTIRAWLKRTKGNAA